jgi:hypothetical protein
MPARAPDRVARLRHALGSPLAPPKIWQKTLDREDGHLHALVGLAPGFAAEELDLVNYALDLQHEAIQPDLLKFLLPICLDAWEWDLAGRDHEYGAFVDHFYPAVVRFIDVLDPSESSAVCTFMQDSILHEIDEQSGLVHEGAGVRPYRWIGAFASHGVIFAAVEELWTRLMAPSTSGRAIAAVQYLSALIYREDENPVFSPWTPDGGGGPPNPWEFAGHLYGHRWRPENVAFLRRALTPDAVVATLLHAVDRLAGRREADAAARVLDRAEARDSVLRHRCEELPRLLETPQEADDLLEWSV